MNIEKRTKGKNTIVVLTPDDGKVIINKEYATYKADGGERPQLLLAQEVCLAVTDTADRYAEIDIAAAEAYQKEYDEAMQTEMMPTDAGQEEN